MPCKHPPPQSSAIVYNTIIMKYALYAIIIAFFAITPTHAQEKGVLSVPTPAPETKKPLKTDPFEVKKQKIQAELTLTVERLSLVVTRTQNAIDLLTKNGKDTTTAQADLDDAKNALTKAQAALLLLEQGAPEKKEVSLRAMTTTSKNPTAELRDQVKDVQDALKDTQRLLIQSIISLKEVVTVKE